MNPWARHHAHALVDDLFDADQIDAETAARAHELVDSNQPSRALTLVRLAAHQLVVPPA